MSGGEDIQQAPVKPNALQIYMKLVAATSECASIVGSLHQTFLDAQRKLAELTLADVQEIEGDQTLLGELQEGLVALEGSMKALRAMKVPTL